MSAFTVTASWASIEQPVPTSKEDREMRLDRLLAANLKARRSAEEDT